MRTTADFKEEFAATDENQWTVFQDPPVWVNQKEELTIRVVEPFGEDDLLESTESDLSEAFDDGDCRVGKIRIEQRGVPYYETEMYVVGIRDERRFLPLGITASGNVNEFNEHLGRVMTESLGYHDYDDVLETAEDADVLD